MRRLFFYAFCGCSMKGTIQAEYYGTSDNDIGLDAWSFAAVKR